MENSSVIIIPFSFYSSRLLTRNFRKQCIKLLFNIVVTTLIRFFLSFLFFLSPRMKTF